MSKINVKVKTIKGGGEDSVTLEVDPCIKVVDFKGLIEQSTLAASAATQRLIYQGKVLKDDNDLASYNLSEGSCILLSGGAKPTTPSTPTLPTTASASPLASSSSSSLSYTPPPPPQAIGGGNLPTAPAPSNSTAPLPSHVVILRAAIAGVKCSNAPEVGATALRTLATIIGNVVTQPHEAKFRSIKRSNPAFDKRVGSVSGASAILRAAGFSETPESWELAPSEHGWNVICSAKAELDAAVATLPTPVVGGGGGPAPSMSMLPGMGGGMPPMPPMPGMGGMDANSMMNVMQTMQQNPGMMQAALQQMRTTNPALAQQAEAMMANPAALQNAMQMMQRDPGMMQQAMAMAQQQGGMPAMPSMPNMMMPPRAVPGQQQQQQQPTAVVQERQGDVNMTEEEMLAEAIARSLREL